MDRFETYTYGKKITVPVSTANNMTDMELANFFQYSGNPLVRFLCRRILKHCKESVHYGNRADMNIESLEGPVTGRQFGGQRHVRD